MNTTATIPVEIRHFHMFGAIGGGAKGFNEGKARVGNLEARFRCIGSVDVDAAANRDFLNLVGVDATTLDLFDRSQYVAFWDREPPRDWREATPDDIRRAAGGERPHIVFLSAPCKGFSGLLSESKSRTAKYQALNRLTLRGIWLMLEAWKDDLPEFVLFENVPRIASRGRQLLDQIVDLLRRYGYAVNETSHDCGELGGLAQSRKRFLLVARNVEKVPPFLYEPEKKRLQGVGTLLGRMPLPGTGSSGPMHRIPSLQWKTWVRLAFVEAGSDWRSLNKLAVENGQLRDYLIVPEMRRGVLGVNRWDDACGVVAGASRPGNGSFSVADPRGPADAAQYQQYGVLAWDDTAGTVTGARSPGQGTFSVADPRHSGPAKHSNEFRIVPWAGASGAVTGAHGTGQCVQDPRATTGFEGAGKYRVTGYDEPAGTVISRSDSGQGAYAVADPRPGMRREKGDDYLTAGHYGVIEWTATSGAVSSAACHDNGRWSVADPRIPAANEKTVAIIRSLDDTWHRPFTTLELAVVQSLVEPEEHLELDGLSDQDWRERIGNAVPSKAAREIAGVMGTTLLLAWSGETFVLSSQPIWVRNIALSITLPETVRGWIQ
ncbi:DNA cytosine methyltransferase [Burkholderia cenocepacia]|uniref:DNA cytosine methyltransferase n=1 Tax=Burkholderia cenocepacia TaxID=95486 RepID=UPI000F5614CC|nr:DNA cytosine methyltransferase [Burkholderia cenocepacia]RQU88699.1 DNA cytosine methyltransferase [Burkholderia cenocepacia]